MYLLIEFLFQQQLPISGRQSAWQWRQIAGLRAPLPQVLLHRERLGLRRRPAAQHAGGAEQGAELAAERGPVRRVARRVRGHPHQLRGVSNWGLRDGDVVFLFYILHLKTVFRSYKAARISEHIRHLFIEFECVSYIQRQRN